MFDHLNQGRRPGLNRTALLGAVAAMLVVSGAAIYGVLLILELAGLTLKRPPVEVTYDPYGDGTQLEDLLGPDEVPSELPHVDTGPMFTVEQE